VTAKSMLYISSSFLHEMEKGNEEVNGPFSLKNQAFSTTEQVQCVPSDRW